MEQFTTGKVSAAARRCYLADYPGATPDQFKRIRGGYIMAAWASQIDRARAMGRGWRAGGKLAAHAFDLLHSLPPELRDR